MNARDDRFAPSTGRKMPKSGHRYPDGLSGAKINDHIRLTAIADVYSALIDKRSYKGSMTSEAALEMMSGFKGHLDMDLVREFRSFTLDNG